MNIIPNPLQPTETIGLSHFNRLCNTLAAEVTQIQASNLPANEKREQIAAVYHRLMRLTLAGQWVRPEGNMRLDIAAPPVPDFEELVGVRSFKTLRGCSRTLPFDEDIYIYLFPDPYSNCTTSDFQFQFVPQACDCQLIGDS